MTETPTPTPAPQMPEGFDDAASPWFIPPELRDHYRPPNIDELLAEGNSVVLTPSPPVESAMRRDGRLVSNEPTPQQMDDWQRRADLAADVHYRAHLAAVTRARDAAGREQAERRHAQQWREQHTCQVCGTVDGQVGARRLVDLPPVGRAWSAPPVRVTATTCPACALTLLAQLLAAHADERLDDGRTRAAAVAAWLGEQ